MKLLPVVEKWGNKKVVGTELNPEDLGHAKDNLTALVFIYKSASMFTKGTAKIF